MCRVTGRTATNGGLLRGNAHTEWTRETRPGRKLRTCTAVPPALSGACRPRGLYIFPGDSHLQLPHRW